MRLTSTGSDEEALISELEILQKEVAGILGDIVISWEDERFEVLLGKILSKGNKTIALAESCTGGYISHLLTQVQGSSQYFKGAIVPYQSSLKHKLLGVKIESLNEYSAISEEVAIELAVNTREVFNSDYSLSVTGQLSYGGEDKHIKKGVIWMAVAGANGVKTKKFQFHYNRHLNKEIAAQMGMLMIWKYINNRL